MVSWSFSARVQRSNDVSVCARHRRRLGLPFVCTQLLFSTTNRLFTRFGFMRNTIPRRFSYSIIEPFYNFFSFFLANIPSSVFIADGFFFFILLFVSENTFFSSSGGNVFFALFDVVSNICGKITLCSYQRRNCFMNDSNKNFFFFLIGTNLLTTRVLDFSTNLS